MPPGAPFARSIGQYKNFPEGTLVNHPVLTLNAWAMRRFAFQPLMTNNPSFHAWVQVSLGTGNAGPWFTPPQYPGGPPASTNVDNAIVVVDVGDRMGPYTQLRLLASGNTTSVGTPSQVYYLEQPWT